MKKYILSLTVLIAGIVSAQVGIEQTSVTNQSVILEFNDKFDGSGSDKGLILPSVATPTGKAGAILFDAPAGIVKLYDGTSWINMTDASSAAPYTAPSTADVSTEGAIMSDGSVKTVDEGVLKLESTTKAVILPRISNVTTALNNPAPGTMVYDLASDSIAVFNGEKWFFWN